MDSLSPHVVSTAKLPILNPNEFDLWKMRIEQYFLMTDYSLWEVILNGDSLVPTRVVEGVVQPVAHTSAEQKLAKKNELKARDQIHDRLQKLVSQLEIHGVSVSQEDVNLKFLRGLPSEWKTHTLIWRNKANLEERSFDDLFNSLKFYDAKVKHSSSTSTTTQNLAFVSSSNTDSTTDSIDVDDLEEMDLRWQMAMLTMRARRDILLGNVGLSRILEEMGVMIGLSSRGGAYQLALMAFSPSSSSSDNELSPSKPAQNLSHTNRPTAPIIEDWSVEISIPTATPKPTSPKSNRNGKGRNRKTFFVCKSVDHFIKDCDYHAKKMAQPTPRNYAQMGNNKQNASLTYKNPPKHMVLSTVLTQSKPVSITIVRPVSADVPQNIVTRPRLAHPISVEISIPTATPKPTSPKSNRNGKRRNRKTFFVCKSVDHFIKDCDYHAKKMAQPTPRNYAQMGNNKQNASLTYKNPPKHMVLSTVLTQSKPVSITIVRPVSADVPQNIVTRPRLAHPIVTKSKLLIRQHIPVANPLRPGNPQYALKDKGVIDSGCSWHMTRNISYLSEFKELNGGYVAFGGNPKGGKISGKGKIKKSKLDFDDVYFVKVLKFNLFSVSQMCDKKNSVLFTDTECLVLSPDFKLPDESQVLLRVPRGNNMLTHINFNTINKLVKGNLVRGLPTKVFENNNTCVACKKGKQHRASCTTKPVSSIDQPLSRLHMDLFGLTFVKSLNKKSYCLVVTDDYSRFTWVFFLTTKDETSPILQTFITGLENQLSLKVKVIRSDNGTEFKIFDLNQFCGMKGITREFSVPRTPQQNGIAERKNRTLIEAARTMLAYSLLPIPFWAEAVNTACYVQNRVLVTKPHNKTPYELLHGRTPSIGFMRPFGCPVTILNTLDSLGKFKGKVDEGFLVGYFVNSKAFRVFNSRTHIV
nr:putative ribonuclease H-like domain-containing protein [Tanacetum cinerariifolium]